MNEFEARNGTRFCFDRDEPKEVGVAVFWPTRVETTEKELEVYLNAEDLLEFVLFQLRKEGIILFDDEETTDILKYIGKRRKE